MINKEELIKPIKKKVLLYSSGMDSYIINELEKPDVLLFIDNKSNYSGVERTYLETQDRKNLIFLDDFVNHSSIELSNMIIPARNLFLVTIATYFGDEIILGATAGDRSSDKDHKFASLTSELLSHIYSKSHWCEGRDIQVKLKYKEWTKRDLVIAFINKRLLEGGSVRSSVRDLILESFSCYYPVEGVQCNACKPDLRKYLAILGATKMDFSKMYPGTNPMNFFTPAVREQWIRELSADTSRGRESLETIEALRML